MLWVTRNILDLSDEMRDLKKRYEANGAKDYWGSKLEDSEDSEESKKAWSVRRLKLAETRRVVSDGGSKSEILSGIEQATAAFTKLNLIWRDNNISLGSKVKLMRPLVFSIFLYACKLWTLKTELEKRTQSFEMRCY